MTQAVWTAVDAYISGQVLPTDAALDAALTRSVAAGLPAINIAPPHGRLLAILARAARAERILEVGTLGGYSTIWLARALPDGGRLITLEISPAHAAVAAENLRAAGVADRVDIRVGAALDSLAALVAEDQPPFDLIFIDADKENNAAYFEYALRLARAGALIFVDNVVREGQVADATSTDARVQGVRRLLDRLATEPRVEATVVQTVGSKGYDGFVLAVVTG